MLSISRFAVAGVVVSAALLGGLVIPDAGAHAETESIDPSAAPEESSAPPSTGDPGIEPYTPPQMPAGSFDIPSPVTTPYPAAVEPVTPPVIGEKFEELLRATNEAARRSRSMPPKSSASGDSGLSVPTEPQAVSSGAGEWKEVETSVSRMRIARQVGGFRRGGCVGNTVAPTEVTSPDRAQCPEARAPSSERHRSNLRSASEGQ
ncbi:hypothetical protein CHE218_33430 [Microbacterium sp. che218]